MANDCHMPDPRVLVTGFEPFGGSNDNPSRQIVQSLETDAPLGVAMCTGLLPVTWSHAWPALHSLIERHDPTLILMLGQSGKRPSVTVERFALNFGQGRLADNNGFERPPGPLVEDAPLALPATIDVERATNAMMAAGVEARTSHDAGAFLCNAVLFHALASARPGVRAGFIHVPMLPGQSGAGEGEPTMAADRSERAVRAAIAALA